MHPDINQAFITTKTPLANASAEVIEAHEATRQLHNPLHEGRALLELRDRFGERKTRERQIKIGCPASSAPPVVPKPYTGLPFSQSSSSPSAPPTPRRGRAPAPGLIAAAPSSLPEPPALIAAIGPSVAAARRSLLVRPEPSALSLFEERALRADVRRHAHDVALAREQIWEMNPRLRALEKGEEELADLKAAAMTSTTQLADEKAQFRKHGQELQRLRAQLRLAEQKADYHQRCHKDGGNAANSAQG
ncbi:MAG: hypothetical protein M1826_000643 [Phylliscum demangeonii]|nr:MAG: hypothetical protein M1826_000643 [Phylliscum demangeonii]